jgi:predicted Zn-dependent protease
MSDSGLDVRALAETVLAAAGEEAAEALVRTERSGFARFAASELHQPTLVADTTVQLRVLRGQRSGTASTNRLDEAGIAELVRRAREAAESATPDDELPPLAPPGAAPAIEGWDDATARLDGDGQARLALAAIDASSLPLYGFFTSGATEFAVASTTGLRAHQRTTDATVRVIAADEGASGYAERTAWSAALIDPAATACEAVARAERTRNAGTIEPGVYRAVLEPYALGELLQWLAFDSFSALGLLDGASFLAGKLGERLFDPAVTIYDDALDPAGLPKAVDFEGVPKQRVALVEAGVARGVVWDSSTAARAGDGSASTGHAMPSAQRAWGPFVSALAMDGGDAPSLEALAEAVGDGIHVTRLHYLSVVSPREGIITGTTRDGTFRIRGGRVAEPLVNLRFTVSVPELLGELLGLTRARLLTCQSDFYDERFAFGALMPGIATARFAVTGSGSSPGL